jgi:two-component system, NtrC family, response regulator AtoC
MQDQVTDLQHTHRPGAPDAHSGALEVLVYLRQHCTVFHLPESGSVRVGRSPSNDLRIDDPSVSRFHFALHIGDVIEVEDLGSANGTSLFRNEADLIADEPTHRNETEARLGPAERRTLGPGDFIRAGVALVVVQVPNAAHPVAVSAISSRPPSDIGPPVLLDPEMKRAYEIAVRAAQSGISVLITGETGAGKEIFAETIHLRSNRRGRPLLRLNCAALSETLLESELFGHERGSFTGATQTKVGLLESNDQGTVFLDEIGEMPLSTQAKLLRVLEEKTILRVGATKPRPIDVRFIWATNRDLRAEARRGKFRHDLYYRIAGVEFSIPPLRQRPLEIEPLARLFLERFCRRTGLPIPALTPAAVAALKRYAWPGNVRELKNVMERAPFLCGAGDIDAEHIPIEVADENGLFPPEETEATEVFVPGGATSWGAKSSPLNASPSPPVNREQLGRLGEDLDTSRARIAAALEQCAGNQTRAAQLLGVSRRTLINHLERLNMPRPKKV